LGSASKNAACKAPDTSCPGNEFDGKRKATHFLIRLAARILRSPLVSRHLCKTGLGAEHERRALDAEVLPLYVQLHHLRRRETPLRLEEGLDPPFLSLEPLLVLLVPADCCAESRALCVRGAAELGGHLLEALEISEWWRSKPTSGCLHAILCLGSN